MTENLPFELFGADANGIPVTYIGLGRMDLSGICREVGIERLEQKMIMQNDMFIDMAREKTLALTAAAGEPTVTHGGVFVIDCDGLGRRHLAEVRIFRHVSAALKVLHPERQRKTFIAVWNSNLQPDFNVRRCDSFDASSSAVLRELDESNRFVQKSAESTSI